MPEVLVFVIILNYFLRCNWLTNAPFKIQPIQPGPLASSIETRIFSTKLSKYFEYFTTYQQYFNFFFLWADSKGICVECVITFYRFLITGAKYFTVYFRRTNKFDSRVAYLILYITVDVIVKQLWAAYGQN